MHHSQWIEAIFAERRNRFLIMVEVNGHLEKAHLPNSGRLRELLIPGAKALIKKVNRPGRKTAYDLWGIYTGTIWVCVDAHHANDLFLQALNQDLIGELRGFSTVEREVPFGTGRLDFCFDKGGERHLVEVKSVTLVRAGKALFPDAPTERGKRHLEELTAAAQRGEKAGVTFIVQRGDAVSFSPNTEQDPIFASALQEAISQGVWIAACSFEIERERIGRGERIPIVL
jgi:sugar fermentation stimulation protein A